ncbi:von Willebrand factor A [Opitutaceae bacterium TAV5]|nr:von Willebrand factor A [Opitutaceae bacterium TAV5]
MAGVKTNTRHHTRTARRNLAVLAVSLLATGLAAVSFAKTAATPPAAATPAPVKLTVELDRPVLPADRAETVVVKVGLTGDRSPARADRPPVNLALVIDKSGSMSGEKIRQARAAALEAINHLSPDDIVSLVVFDSEVRTLRPAARLGDGRQLRDAINEIAAGGMTALYGGVTQAAAELRKSAEPVSSGSGAREHSAGRILSHRMLLLSDGAANVGPSSPDDLGRAGAALRREGISVTTIGLGLGFNEDLMTRLARRSDGNTYFVEHSADLPRIFSEELGDVLSVVARSVVVEVTFPEGVRPRHIVGRDGSIDGQRARIDLGQVYGGQEKFVLVEAEVSPAASSGRNRPVANAAIRYEDATTGRPQNAAATASVTFTTDEKTVIASANHRVQADYAENKLAETRDRAIALVDAGRRDDAARLLNAQSDEFRVLGGTYNNTAVSTLAPAPAAAAEQIATGNFDNATRKTWRASSLQTVNQQRVKNDATPDAP